MFCLLCVLQMINSVLSLGSLGGYTACLVLASQAPVLLCPGRGRWGLGPGPMGGFSRTEWSLKVHLGHRSGQRQAASLEARKED